MERASRPGISAWLTSAIWLAGCSSVRAPLPVPPEPAPAEHETGRAGEVYLAEVLGAEVAVKARDRNEVMAVALGATLQVPPIGDTQYSPFASFYYYGDWEERRLRAQVSVLVNDVEFAERFRSLEAIVRLSNDQSRLLGRQAETVSGEELEDTNLDWGRVTLSLGLGWAFDLAPFNVDNQLRLQLFYREGYDYFSRIDKTGEDLVIPNDTWVNGVRLRLRIDGMQRNLLELPHDGYAFGADLDLSRRNRWEHETPTSPGQSDPVTEPGDRDFLKLSGYAIVAGGFPFLSLSDRHRFRAQLYAGWSPNDALDRFSAFRIGGGPLPTEAADLGRILYPGALFDQFITKDYVLTRLGYRYELFFFLYLNAAVSVFHGKVASLVDGTTTSRFRSLWGESLTAAVTTGFPWDSTLNVEYDYDTHLVRGDSGGSQVLLLWSKQL